MAHLPWKMKQEPVEMAVSPPLGGDELRCRLEDLVAELSVRGVQKTSASRTRNSGERIQGGSLQGETERRAKMAEAVIGRSATRAGDQCVISVDSEDGAAAEASRRVKQEAMSQWGGSGAEHRALSVHAEKIVQEEVTSSRCAGATSELDQNKGACINKPTYDGKADWRMFLIQFELMAKLEGWTDKEKTVGIITSLTGDALPYLRFIDVAHGDSYESVLAQLSDCFVGIQVARPRDGPRADHGSGSRASVSDRMPGAGRSMVKAGRYDGTSPWEAYQAKFKMAALNNAWSPTEKAGQLAAALDGKALQVLLDLGPDELESYDVIATALDRRFGRVEPAVGLRQRLATRIRGPGEKLGVLAADVLYLARRGYPDYPPATQGDLAMEAFVRGLTPNALRQQVRLAAPTSLELALAHAERVEAVLEEGERDWAPGGNQREGREWTDRPRPTARQAQAEEEETADSHAAPPWISDLAALIRTVSTQAPHTRLCWNCGKPGHLQRRCPSAAAPPNCSSSEKHQGARVSGTTSGIMAHLPRKMKQEPAEIAVSPPLGGDELRCRLEDLVAELSVRGVQKTSASRTRNSGERIQGGSLQGETERRAKMAEAVIGRSATRAGDQCVISVDSEDGAAAEASRRVKQEATSQWGGSGAEHRALSVHAEKIVQEEVTSSRCAGATSELDQNKGACINKPTYDGKADWRMFLIQFELMAKLEGWTDKEKTVGIITSLTGDALPYLRFIDVAHGDSYESVLAQLSDCFVGIQVARPRDGPRADHGSGSRASVSDRMPGAGRSMVKAGRYDGTSPWEAYQAKFKMT
ncbi:UNVERIFIED_CONTAM: hypothetical protein FKN15_061846 [Acipenser sinensis]